MASLLCLLGHRWVRGKWGSGRSLDCRECSRCGRFQIWAYWSFHNADRAAFGDAVFAASPTSTTEEPTP